MSRRKTKRTSSGEVPPLTRLKDLPAAERFRVLQILDAHTYEKAQPKVAKLVGFSCSTDVLSKFWQWQSKQQDLEASNDFIAQFEDFTRKQNPDWSAEKVRDHAIAYFMAQTTSRNDLKGFVAIAQIDQNERSGRIKAALDERKVRVAEGRLALLEKKAAQADQAKGVMEDKALTLQQREARMKEIFGIS